jgi:GNAT superfamily N-acetyltransferase
MKRGATDARSIAQTAPARDLAVTTLFARARRLSDRVNFSAVETLRDGRRIEIRALKPSDQVGLKVAISGISAKSLYRRFFSMKRHFSEKEVAHFMNVDFVAHVALVAVAEPDIIVGGGRYVVTGPGVAEIAFAIVDEYQGQGLGTTLLRHLIFFARGAALKELVAHVLPDNRPMLAVFEKCGLQIRTQREDGAISVVLRLSDVSTADAQPQSQTH